MAVTQALHFTNDGATAAEFREVHQHLWTRHRAGVLRTGLTTADDSLLVTEKSGTPDMSVDVASGAAAVLGTEATAQGVYLAEAPTTTNVSISAADPTNARKDVIVVRIKDQDYTSGSPSTNTTTIEAVAGTPSGSPALPTIPDNCVLLAIVDVAALASSITNANITDQRWTGFANHATQDNGSIAAVGGSSTGLSTALPQLAPTGHRHWCTDLNLALVWDGAAWTGDGEWQTYAPTLFNFTASSTTMRYTRIGRTYHFVYNFTITAVTGSMGIGLPITPQTGGWTAQGYGIANDVGTTFHEVAHNVVTGGPRVDFYTRGTAQVMNATNPHTWIAGDTIEGAFTLEGTT